MSKLGTLAASLISAGVATLITAAVVEKQLLKEFDERLQKELAESVEFLEETGKAEPTESYQEQHKQLFGTKFSDAKPSLEEVLNKNQKVRYDQIVKSQGYSPDEVVQADDGTLMLAKPEGEVEIDSSLPDIHPISTEEFMENESGFDQCSVSYFADGGVLDEQGELVVAHEDLIGPGVPPFGQLSGEPHVVYIRNVRRQREIEVIRDEANAADILATPGTPGDVT